MTDINIGLKSLDSTLFPGVSSSVQVHSGFADAHAETATTILGEVKKLLSSSGASTVVTVSAPRDTCTFSVSHDITGTLVGRHPFGGLGLSGVGSKAGGADYLLQFVEPRAIAENTMRRGFAPEIDPAGGP